MGVRVAWLAWAVGMVACVPERLVKLDIDPAVADTSDEIRIFAYDRATQPGLDCARFDPNGAPPGDAPERTGLTPDRRQRSPISDRIEAFEASARSLHVFIIEAWKNEPAILRAHACREIDFSSEADAATPMVLEPLVPPGAHLSVLTGHSSALTAVEGETAFGTLEVEGEGLAGRRVHYEIVAGHGFLEAGGEVGQQLAVVAGTSSAAVRLRAAVGVFQNLRVRAHAAGYVDAPLEFVATVFPSFDSEIDVVDVPRSRIDLGERDRALGLRPIVVADFDGDGRPDVVTGAGRGPHRLAIFYATASGGYDLAVTAPQPGELIALATVAIGATKLPSLIASAAVPSGLSQLRLWRNPGTRASANAAEWQTSLISSHAKAAIDLAVHDLDGDELADLALIRCKDPLEATCYDFAAKSVSAELAVMRNRGDGVFEEVWVDATSGAKGGLSQVRIADLNGDGRPDLLALMVVFGYRHFHGQGDFRFNQGETLCPLQGRQRWWFAVTRPTRLGSIDILGTAHTFEDNAILTPLADYPRCKFQGDEKDLASLLHVGPMTAIHDLPVEAVDLNGDDRDDALVLHRATGVLSSFITTGGSMAPGPGFDLGIRAASELAVARDETSVHVATVDWTRNRLVTLRLRPRR